MFYQHHQNLIDTFEKLPHNFLVATFPYTNIYTAYNLFHNLFLYKVYYKVIKKSNLPLLWIVSRVLSIFYLKPTRSVSRPCIMLKKYIYCQQFIYGIPYDFSIRTCHFFLVYYHTCQLLF